MHDGSKMIVDGKGRNCDRAERLGYIAWMLVRVKGLVGSADYLADQKAGKNNGTTQKRGRLALTGCSGAAKRGSLCYARSQWRWEVVVETKGAG